MSTFECLSCHWSGTSEELLCSDEEADSAKPAKDCTFNRCPTCGTADNFEEAEGDDEDEEMMP